MKYEIDTMPVWDALRADTECCFCLLERRSRNSALRYYLGPSVMVPEVRVEVNEVGFSPENTRLLAKDQNKLGLALISHTRLKTLDEKIQKKTQALLSEAGKVEKKGPLSSKNGLKELINAYSSFLETEEARCLIEEKVQDDLARFAFTALHLWQKDPDFSATWKKSKGLCLPHALPILKMSVEILDARTLASFILEFFGLQKANLGRIGNDLLSFIQSFDGTKSHISTGNPAQALDRSLQKLSGAFKEYEEESKTRRGPLLGS